MRGAPVEDLTRDCYIVIRSVSQSVWWHLRMDMTNAHLSGLVVPSSPPWLSARPSSRHHFHCIAAAAGIKPTIRSRGPPCCYIVHRRPLERPALNRRRRQSDHCNCKIRIPNSVRVCGITPKKCALRKRRKLNRKDKPTNRHTRY